ncbi:MAG: hypothetical protein ACKO7P_09340, partial [Bacteroidota bacterium]
KPLFNRQQNSLNSNMKDRQQFDFGRSAACNSVYVAIAGEVVNRKYMPLRNFVQNVQENASNPPLHIHANH